MSYARPFATTTYLDPGIVSGPRVGMVLVARGLDNHLDGSSNNGLFKESKVHAASQHAAGSNW